MQDDRTKKRMKYTVITQPPDSPIIFDQPGRYAVFFRNIAGDYTFVLRNPGVEVEIFGLFEGKDTMRYNLRTTQLHTAPNTTSNLLIKGVFEDASVFDYSGLIRIKCNCNGAHAYQKNQNLLLSSRASVRSEPNLEIMSNDVFCTHGSTTGTLNPEHLLYLQTRGIAKEPGVELLKQGFICDLLDRLPKSSPS
jgi:Fe-S cluster assembly protein SufD